MKRIFIIFLHFLVIQQVYGQYSTGLVFDDDKYENAPKKATLTRGLYVEAVPSSNSMKQYCPTPMDQGQYGTCVGWSSNWAARTIVEAMKNGWTSTNVINQNAYSPGFIYQMIKDKNDKNCSYGASIFDALNYMKFNGSIKYSSLEEQCVPTVPQNLKDQAMRNKIKDFARLFDQQQGGDYKIQTVKKSIAENNPVVFGMKCAPSFYDAIDVWEPTENHETKYGGHAMCVVGYDDNKGGGAFEIMNSWGTDWGNEGFIWIKYQDFANFTKYAYEIITDPAPKPPTVADLSGKLKFVTDKGEEMKAELLGQSYKMQKSYSSGTSFRIYISNNEPAYVYALGSDKTAAIFQLFPYAPGVSAALNYSQNQVAYPSEDHYITMDNTVGTDYICVLYSKHELNIEEIKRELEGYSGSMLSRTKKVIGQNLVKPENIQYSSSEMAFKGYSKGKTVLALVVAIDHIQ
ncbi:MAG: DUF4384 domain-containing protein [Flammeovirgaceae bacterium]|nr:DUF4384 domain-containing protein [Flammeovirgaceae bacterium]